MLSQNEKMNYTTKLTYIREEKEDQTKEKLEKLLTRAKRWGETLLYFYRDSSCGVANKVRTIY